MHFARSLLLIGGFALAAMFAGSTDAGAADSSVVLRANADSIPLGANARVLEDPRGELTFDQVKARSAEFRAPPVESNLGLNFGYSRSVWWVKIELQRTPDSGFDWLLEVAFPQLDRIDFFGPDGTKITTGDTFPAASRPVLNRHFVFPVFPSFISSGNLTNGETVFVGNESATIYLRIASEGILIVPLTLWQRPAFYRDTQFTYALLAVLYGAILTLGLFNLLLYKDFGDTVYLNFALFSLSIVFAQFSVNGFAAEMLWPGFPEWGNIAPLVIAAICGCTGMLFIRRFLDTARVAPWLDGVILAFAGLFGLGLITPLFLATSLVSILLSFVAIGGLLVAQVAAIQSARRGIVAALWFLLAGTPLFVAAAGTVLRNINVLPVNFFTLHGARISIVFLMFILSYALAQKISATQRERDISQSEGIQTRQKLVETLRRSEQELELRVTQRTDALEQANSRLRENERQLKDAAHTDPLTGLANRLLLDAHLRHAILTTRRDKSTFALLLIDLDKFKPVNDTYGHAIGDDVLRTIGLRLRTSIREMDTVARLGGDEFAIVLHSFSSINDIEIVARKINLAVAQPIKVLGVPIEIGASIGIALYEPELRTLGDLLRRADTAMYECKKVGGGSHRFFAGKTALRAETSGGPAQGNPAA